MNDNLQLLKPRLKLRPKSRKKLLQVIRLG